MVTLYVEELRDGDVLVGYVIRLAGKEIGRCLSGAECRAFVRGVQATLQAMGIRFTTFRDKS